MSMNPQAIGSIPAETVRIARAACPKGTLAMRLRDALGELYQDEQFLALYPVDGQPGYTLVLTGAGHGAAIHGESDGSASGQRRARTH
jgi:hypothetical protein